MDKVVVLAAGLGTRMRSGELEGLSEAQRRAADSGSINFFWAEMQNAHLLLSKPTVTWPFCLSVFPLKE